MLGSFLNPSTCTEHPCHLNMYTTLSWAQQNLVHGENAGTSPFFVNEQSCLFTCYKSRTEQGQMSYSLSKTNIPTNWSFSEAWQPLAHQSQHMQIITCIPKHLTPQLCNNFVEIILSTKGYLPKATNEAMFLKPV